MFCKIKKFMYIFQLLSSHKYYESYLISVSIYKLDNTIYADSKMFWYWCKLDPIYADIDGNSSPCSVIANVVTVLWGPLIVFLVCCPYH